jgi:hypothetical protein
LTSRKTHQQLFLARCGAFRRRTAIRKLTGGIAGETPWTSALNPSWPTFSRSRAKTLTRSARGVRVVLADCEAIFRAQETNKRMRDNAALVCRPLCRARVVAEMHQRRGTQIAEHLTLVLSVIDRQER